MALRRTLPLLGLLLFAAPAWGQGIPSFLSARGVAIGGTRALASGNEALFLNPAGLAVSRMYTVQLDYGHDAAPSSELTSGDGLVVSIGDSASNPRIATAVAYRYASLTTNGVAQRGSVTDLGFATPLSDHFFLGLKMSYLSFTEGSNETKKFTGDVGGIFAVGGFRASIVGFNLIGVQDPDAARGFATGLAYSNNSSFSLGGDVRFLYPSGLPSTRTYSAGGEVLIAKMFPVRAGYVYDGVTTNKYLTAGLGFYIAQFGADITYRRTLNTAEGTWLFAVKFFAAGS